MILQCSAVKLVFTGNIETVAKVKNQGSVKVFSRFGWYAYLMETGQVTTLTPVKVGDQDMREISKEAVITKGRIQWTEVAAGLDLSVTAENTLVIFDWTEGSKTALHRVEFDIQDGSTTFMHRDLVTWR